MGVITIQEYTTKEPISLIGAEAGICWGACVSDKEKNFKRGIECLDNQHGRTWEFPEVYLTLSGYSARVIREWYTHIGGAPTRLQASTRYINYGEFDYVTPPSLYNSNYCNSNIETYEFAMEEIKNAIKKLEDNGVPREDAAMLLPLGMETKVVCKINARTLIDMSHQRMCSRAYWEFRELFRDLNKALMKYSKEWEILVEKEFQPKCKFLGYCPEKFTCGKVGRKTI